MDDEKTIEEICTGAGNTEFAVVIDDIKYCTIHIGSKYKCQYRTKETYTSGDLCKCLLEDKPKDGN